ncbi:surfactin synthase thioesterase subunit [Chitinivorax tropicus]|uniref:Surfactin synthase thioesterase subunit n=1 Tax=Chitinivorax tropicus TaxID=714531 RepID=A0A840MPK7_9PROT|nr:alpha/beta fold hydrolase [Chitinivorax tropicus]MBB5020380.1 surfactin synthase thioesterase subunit [Chitinivorax tropicus]
MARALTLLALPCAGASAAMYLRWRQALPDWVTLRPVELPGRGTRLDEPFATRFDQLVAQLAGELADEFQRPYVLLGHSMGAQLAYGLSRHQLSVGGPMPLAMFVLGSPAPSMPDPRRFQPCDRASLIADMREQGGTPEAVFAHPELLEMSLTTLAADYTICDSIHFAAPLRLPLPVHVLAGRQDGISAERMHAWQRETGGTFTLDWFDGGHFFFQDQTAPVMACLNRLLAHCRHAPHLTQPA